MTPAARVQAAIEILDLWRASAQGMDRVLTGWARQNRYAGSGDRRAIGDLVHSALRRLRSSAWVAGHQQNASGRATLHGLLLLQGMDPGEFFTGAGHAPSALTPDEIAERRSLDDASRAVRFDYPEWLEPHLGLVDDEELQILQERAPLDLRVNLLKTDLRGAARALESEGIHTVPGPLSSTALRVVDGQRRVQSSRAFTDGLVEIQDAASQAIADLAGVQGGEVVLDLCAGAGGKTLALAAMMQGQGRLIAHDIDTGRMADLPKRAERAGAVIQIAPSGNPPDSCDLVVVDAPCSGSGTWRRNPDAKWRLDANALTDLCGLQAQILEQAAKLVRPGGKVVYATCSLFGCENEDQVASFLSKNPGWHCVQERRFRMADGGDGFFGSVLTVI